jgi:hypothetical protein
VRAAAAEAPHAAVPVAVDETLKAGEDPRTRARLAAVLATPEMNQAIAEVAKAAVAAALDEASSAASEERVAHLTQVVAGALAESLARDIVPAMLSGTRESLRANVSAEDVDAMKATLGKLVAASTSAALHTAADEIPTTVAPAVRASLARELKDPELHEAVSGVVGDATRQVLVSTRQAVVDARAENVARDKPGLLTTVGRALTLSWLLALALGVVAVGLVGWVLHMRRRTKRYRGALLELMTNDKRAEQSEVEEKSERAQRFLELLQ